KCQSHPSWDMAPSRETLHGVFPPYGVVAQFLLSAVPAALRRIAGAHGVVLMRPGCATEGHDDVAYAKVICSPSPGHGFPGLPWADSVARSCASRHRIPRVWALMGRVESQHDVLLRDACLHQGAGKTRFGPIILDPYLPVLNIDL